MDNAPAVRVGLPVEVTAVWLLFALVTVEIFVTYSRVPATELYHVSGRGLEAGANGMDGLLLVLSALLLSRALSRTRVLAAYLALMFCYGVGNIANDFWIEQVFKRGWTTWQIPNVLEPRLTVAWGVIVLAAAALWWLARRRSRDAPPAGQTAHA